MVGRVPTGRSLMFGCVFADSIVRLLSACLPPPFLSSSFTRSLGGILHLAANLLYQSSQPLRSPRGVGNRGFCSAAQGSVVVPFFQIENPSLLIRVVTSHHFSMGYPLSSPTPQPTSILTLLPSGRNLTSPVSSGGTSKSMRQWAAPHPAGAQYPAATLPPR